MSESEKILKINQFTGVTNVHQERAKYYLVSADWNIETALDNFYEEGAYNVSLSDAEDASTNIASASNHDSPIVSTTSNEPVAKRIKLEPLSSSSSSDEVEDEDSDSEDSDGEDNDGKDSDSEDSDVKDSDVKDSDVKDNDGEDSDNEEEQRFCRGNSITSEIIKSLLNNSDAILRMFYEVKRNANRNASAPSSSNNPTHESILFPNSASTSSDYDREIILKMFKEGFTINDGEMHGIDKPENIEFLYLVATGVEIPALLKKKVKVRKEDDFCIIVEDHRWKQSGSPASETVGNDVPKETPPDNGIANEEAARAEVPLIPDTPTTSLQIRFGDGQRHIAEFNLNHTIGDVRRYIMAARSSFSSRPFKLQTSFPPTTLENDELTLLEAGLLNTVIFQRIG